MTSTNSSSKLLAVLKNNFRRYAALFAVFQILVAGVTAFCIFNNASDYNESNVLKNITPEYSSMAFPLIAAVLGIEAFILVLSMFRGIYSKKASDYHFSLPVKRSTWFHANFLFGIISIAVSYALFYIISMLVVNYKTIGRFVFISLHAGKFLKYTFISFVAVVVIYAVFVMCAVVAGRVWQYILLSFISTAVFYVGILGFIFYLNTIYGAWINMSEAYTLSALYLLFTDVIDAALSIWKYFISAAVQFAVFYAVGYVSFKKRKAEVAENRLSGKVLPVVLTAVCFLAEMLICLGLGNEISLFVRIIAGLILVAITAVILSAIFFRKAISKPMLISVAGALAVSAVCVLSVQLIPEKTYVNTIPEKENVKSVTLVNYGDSGSTSIIDVLYGLSYVDTTKAYPNSSYKFSSDDAKDKIIQLHQKLIANETRKNIFSEEYYSKGNITLSLEYQLENGKTLKRFYDVTANDVISAYVDLLNTEEGLNQINVFWFPPEAVAFVTVDDTSFEEDNGDITIEEAYENTVFLKNIDAGKLYACIKEDLKAVDPYDFLYCAGLYFDDGIEYADGLSYVEDTMYLDYNLQLGFYKLSGNANKDKLESVSLKELLIAEDYRDYNQRWTDSFFITINPKKYKNTVSYLKEAGYKFE